MQFSKLNHLILNPYTLPLTLIAYIVLVGSSNIYLNDTFLASFYSTHKLSESLLFDTSFTPIGYFSFYLITIINFIRPDYFLLDIYQCYMLVTLLFFYFFILFIIDLKEKVNLFVLLLLISSIYIEKSYPFYSTTALIFFMILVINYLPIDGFIKNKINNKYFFLFTILIIFFTRQDLAVLALLAFGIYGYIHDKFLLIISIITFFILALFIFFLIIFTNSSDYINLFFNASVNRHNSIDIYYELKFLIISPHFIMLLFLFLKNILFSDFKNLTISKIDIYFFLINIIFFMVDFQTGTREILFLSGIFNTIYFFNQTDKSTLLFIIIIANSYLIQQSANHFFLNLLKKDHHVIENIKIPKFKLHKDYQQILMDIENLYLQDKKIVNISNTRFFDIIYDNKNEVFLPIWLDDNVTFYKHHIKRVHNSITAYDPDFIIIQDTNNSKINDCVFEFIDKIKDVCLISNYFQLIKKLRKNYELLNSYDMKNDNNIYVLTKIDGLS